jgi:hypothetical protein
MTIASVLRQAKTFYASDVSIDLMPEIFIKADAVSVD